MFTFLRKIRKSLIESGSAHRYFLYAVGEILLVMIGILLALQVNNWNENRKEDATEIELLLALKEETASNIDQLKSGLNIHKSSKQQCILLLQYFADPGQTNTPAFLDSLVENISYPYGVNLKKGIVKSIIATGDLKLIDNDDIVAYLTVFEDRLQEIVDDFARLNRIYEGQLWPLEHKYIRRLNRATKLEEFFGHEIPGSLVESDYKAFFEDEILENTFVLTLYEQTDFINGEEVLLSHMEEALKLIQFELDSKGIKIDQ